MTVQSIRDRSMLLLFLLALAIRGFAQQTPPLVVKPLKGGVYWTAGGVGGNTGFIVGQKGVIVIDAKTTPESAKEMLAEIAKITPKPVTTVILTHSDRDHVNGLAAFPKGVTVIAHENNKREQEAALQAGGSNAPPRDYLPTQVVTKERESLKLDGVRVTLIHVTQAHTGGDLAIYLPAQKIAFAGDLILTNRFYPLIHLEKSGSTEGWGRFVKTLAELNAETYVPGHGDLLNKAGVQKILTDAQEKRAKIVAMAGEGKSLEEIKSALGDKPEPVAPGSPTFPSYTEVVYKEVAKK